MSYKVEIQTYSCAPDAWTANQLRFDTEANAQAYGKDLAARWTAVKHWRITECVCTCGATFPTHARNCAAYDASLQPKRA